jgi:hypothetical protein
MTTVAPHPQWCHGDAEPGCAGDALDPPLWKVPNTALSISLPEHVLSGVA